MFGLKIKKPRQFKYDPRYYDPEAEARAARRKAVLGDEYTDDNYKPGALIREGRLRRTQSASRVQKGSKYTLVRAAIFIALVFAVLYIMTSYFELL